MNLHNGLTYAGPIILQTYSIMSLLFFPVLLSIIYNLNRIINVIKSIDRGLLFLLLIVFIIGFWARNTGYRYGIDVDGLYYQEMAKSIHEKGIFAQGCSIGNPADCKFYNESVVLPGYPFLITVLFRFFGVHDILAMFISGILSSVSIFLVFAIYHLLFEDAIGALISSAVFAFLPLDIYIAQTAAVRPTAIFFMCLTIIFFLIAQKERKLMLWLSAIFCMSFTVYVRLEFYLLLIPLCLYALWDRTIRLTRNNIILIGAGLTIFLLHQFFALDWLWHRKFGLTGGNYQTFSFAHLMSFFDIFSNLFTKKLIGEYLFNPIASILFLIGGFLLFFSKNDKRQLIFLNVLFLVFFIGIALFYHGNSGKETTRYLQLIIIPYSLLAGYSLTKIVTRIKKNAQPMLLLLFIIICSLPFMISTCFNSALFSDKRKDEIWVASYSGLYKDLPSDSLVFTWQPQVFNFDIMRDKRLTLV